MQACVFIFLKRCDYDTQLLRFFIKFKNIVLHHDIKFGEVLISWNTMHDIFVNRQQVFFAFEAFIKGL